MFSKHLISQYCTSLHESPHLYKVTEKYGLFLFLFSFHFFSFCFVCLFVFGIRDLLQNYHNCSRLVTDIPTSPHDKSPTFPSDEESSKLFLYLLLKVQYGNLSPTYQN